MHVLLVGCSARDGRLGMCSVGVPGLTVPT